MDQLARCGLTEPCHLDQYVLAQPPAESKEEEEEREGPRTRAVSTVQPACPNDRMKMTKSRLAQPNNDTRACAFCALTS